MLRTITFGTCVSVQGTYVKSLSNGKIVVQVGKREFEGFPVSRTA